MQSLPNNKRRSSSRRANQRGNVIIEFAMIFPFLVLMVAGSFTLGSSLTKSIQASNVCRNANALMSRDVSIGNTENQKMLIRSAAGMGFNISGTDNPDPNGKGAIILSKIIRVGTIQCSLGIPNWNGQTSSCANYGQYVIAQRVGLCNTGRWSSVLGSPVSPTDPSTGKLSDANIATNYGNRAVGFPAATTDPGYIYLDNDGYAFFSEVFADVSELNLLPFVTAPNIAIRNIS